MAQLIKIGKMWYSDLRMGDKRIRRALSSDKRFAEEKLADLVKWRSAQKEGSRVGELDWKLFKDRYIDSCSWKKENSQTHDKLALRYLEETFPIKKLSQVTPALLESARGRWLGPHGKANHINRLVTAVVAAMHKAEAWNLLPKQNWEMVKPIKTTKARKEFWSIEILSEMVQRLKEPYKTVAYIGGQAGLRLDEMRHLVWEDVDFKRKRLNLNPKQASETLDEWDPKAYQRRTIPMPRQLQTHLQSLSKESDYVLGEGRMKSAQVLSKMMSRTLKDTGFKGTAHKLRHTYASHLVMAGVPIYTVSKWLGHASVRVTEEHYAHLAESHIDQAILKLPALSI